MKIAEIRKRLLATPTTKRDRNEEGEWQSGTELQEARKIDSEVKMTPKRMTKTSMGSFMVPQTIEERRRALKPSSNIVPDMSALPTLKPRRKTQPSRKMVQADGLKVKMMPGKVTNIAKMFETQQSATKTVPEPEDRLNIDNNTSVFRQRTGYTDIGSSSQDPEMVLQSVLGAKPMLHQHGGWVTTYSGAEPITAQMTRTDQTSMGGSHIVPGDIQKKFDGQK
jgi:hypothetical protein